MANTQAKDFLTQAKKTIKKDTPKKNAKGNTVSIPIGYELRPETKSKRLNLLIKPSVYDLLKETADAEGQTINSYINNLIEKEVIK